jgi:ribosomal protein L16/L10AE
MGKGKGAHFKWICPVKIGQILLEFRFKKKSFLEILLLLRKCKKKLPIKTKLLQNPKNY